jgi:hypothetical protein
MRKFLYALAIGTLAAAISTPVFAQSASDNSGMAPAGSVTEGNTTISSGGAPDADFNVARYKAWDEFRSSNPGIVAELRHNPRLANNEGFVNKHPQLKQLFAANSGMQEDLMHNPGNYLARSYGRGYSMNHHHHHHAEPKTAS